MKQSLLDRSFTTLNALILAVIGLLCFLPFVHIFAVSLSSNAAVTGGLVRFWPIDFSWQSYHYVLQDEKFVRSLIISLKRVVLGVSFTMSITILTAYPLSKMQAQFRPRTFFAWFFVFTMLFNGGLIPWFLIIDAVGLIDSIWALVIPSGVAVFHIILVLNFFRGLPKELEEAAYVDGASHWTLLFRIYIFLSLPVLATVLLFTMVTHWNSWFDGLILMNNPKDYPFQTYMQSVIIEGNISSVVRIDLDRLSQASERSVKAAQIFLGTVPILIAYPFLQRFFMQGIVLGSVKE